MKKTMIILLLHIGVLSVYAQPKEEVEASTSEDSLFMLVQEKVNTLEYQTGEISIGDDLASLHIDSTTFKYLDPANSEFVLTTLWGNPSGESLGMIFPKDMTPMSDPFSYAVNIYYEEDGHVEDDDAEDIDYDELLEQMQEDAIAANEYRRENGYEAVELIGWASPPFYDVEAKKLHWAKELSFESVEENTLNYNIRILGRKGVLVLNVISDMSALPQVQQDVDKILASVEFNSGNRYADFDPDLDEVAAYGIGGLIAGKILAKAGLFAKLGIFLAKGWKIILLVFAGGIAVIRKFFTGKKSEDA